MSTRDMNSTDLVSGGLPISSFSVVSSVVLSLSEIQNIRDHKFDWFSAIHVNKSSSFDVIFKIHVHRLRLR